MPPSHRSTNEPLAHEFGQMLDDLVEELDMGPEPTDSTTGSGGGRRRSCAVSGEEDLVRLRWVERDGVLLLDDGTLAAPPTSERRGRRTPEAAEWETHLARLPNNEVGAWLDKLDSKLSPHRGLHEHDPELGIFTPNPDLRSDGSILLLVHGTFSNTPNMFDSMTANPEGADFFRWAGQHYDRIVTYDHPTLAHTPILNARELGLLLTGCPADIDVVCHSRGGLVARWWMEVFDVGPGRRRVVFVQSPLSGTHLAAPPKIRDSLSLLGNYGRALGKTAGGVPVLAFVAGVFHVVGSVRNVAAKTPAVDAAVALIPGLAAQSRVGNNHEIDSLRAATAAPNPVGRYFAVGANFEPDAPGWRFWEYFRGATARAADIGADIVFPGDNDLVVDTESVAHLAEGREGGPAIVIPAGQIHLFGAADGVHHLNVFQHADTLQFIRESF